MWSVVCLLSFPFQLRGSKTRILIVHTPTRRRIHSPPPGYREKDSRVEALLSLLNHCQHSSRHVWKRIMGTLVITSDRKAFFAV